MQSNKTLFLVEVAIFTAFALLLDILPFLKFKIWPTGGSISLAMIPIFIIAFRWGIKGGLLSGFLWGILQIVVGDASIYYFWQGVIEYGFAYTALGFAGIFANKLQASVQQQNNTKALLYICLGVFIGGLCRLLAHFYAGIIFFGEYAPEGQSVWIYSLVYNSSYMIPGMIICIFATFFLFSKQPRLFKLAA